MYYKTERNLISILEYSKNKNIKFNILIHRYNILLSNYLLYLLYIYIYLKVFKFIILIYINNIIFSNKNIKRI